jgi:hypothetical protein
MSISTLSPPFLNCFDEERLQNLGQENAEKYVSASPFPHICLDGIFSEDYLEKVLEEIENLNEGREKKCPTNVGKSHLDARNPEQKIPPYMKFLLYELNSAPFLQFLEQLTGVQGLIPDPYYFGGGLHQTSREGFLKIHADFNWHTELKLDRRVNFLLYLNKDWEEEYGGHVEVWDDKMEACQGKYLPVFNRTVVFNTTDYSYHGHPEPIKCPEDVKRKSIALYYYTNGRPKEEVRVYRNVSTLYEERPDENIRSSKERLFLNIKKKMGPLYNLYRQLRLK